MKNIRPRCIDDRLGRDFPYPEYATPGSAGKDIRACIDEAPGIRPGQTALIPTGFAMHIDDNGLAAALPPRPGPGHSHGIVPGNPTGLNDPDYQGQVFVSCWNRGSESFTINPGDRIAQMMFIPVLHANFTVVDNFNESARGAGGFGHTGV